MDSLLAYQQNFTWDNAPLDLRKWEYTAIPVVT